MKNARTQVAGTTEILQRRQFTEGKENIFIKVDKVQGLRSAQVFMISKLKIPTPRCWPARQQGARYWETPINRVHD